MSHERSASAVDIAQWSTALAQANVPAATVRAVASTVRLAGLHPVLALDAQVVEGPDDGRVALLAVLRALRPIVEPERALAEIAELLESRSVVAQVIANAEAQ